MMDTKDAFSQIAMTLAKHFDSLYYVDIETGQYFEYVPLQTPAENAIPKYGDDFFAESIGNSGKYIHPDDMDRVINILNKEAMKKRMKENNSYSLSFRMLVNGNVIHMRHIEVKCEDERHVLCCLENVEKEFRKKRDLERSLETEKKLARRDSLTGVRNNNAYSEFAETVDERIKARVENYQFAVVMCDINDLKLINDTRGHSFGDEAIQRASRMICDTYKHSPVFRVGGDEFVVFVSDTDYERKEILLEKLKKESILNAKSRTGPTVACGMAIYDPEKDADLDAVYERADQNMYQDKKFLKSNRTKEGFANMEKLDEPIPEERKRLLDGMFGALITVAGGGYIYLNDMRYDFSRWSLSLIDDFGLESEYMYHADQIWQHHIHPEDALVYREAVDKVLSEDGGLQPIKYRARKADGTYVVCSTRGFVLMDKNGDPEYFGGIIVVE